MEFRILGPLEVVDAGRDLTPRPAKRRALLAYLLVHRSSPVPADRLIDVLWNGRPPRTAPTALHGHVSALRKLLGPDRIRTQPAGYVLRVGPGELDADRFEALAAEATQADSPAKRAEQLAEALSLWRGEPLADFRYDDFAQAEIERLSERRSSALEERLDTELALGRHDRALPELERLVAEQPMRERARTLLMLALYRAGRQGDALHVAQEGRQLLADELGLEPGPALKALELQILRQDPALEPPDDVEPVRQERKRVTVLVAEYALADAADPEELDRRLAPALAQARAVAGSYGATVRPLYTNAVAGIFGARRSYEDDADRAAHAGSALVAAAAEHKGVSVRVGIDAGDALVTIAGEDVDVTGDVVAAAARVQAAAAANTVGLGVRVTAAMRGAAAAHEPTLVGREHELRLLEEAFGRVARERTPQLATIGGEPGSGKTRLTDELRRRLESAASCTWLTGRCLPYGDGAGFRAPGEIVKGFAGILESDDPELSRRKLATALDGVLPDDGERRWLAATVGALVGLPAPGERAREQTFAAWRRLVESVAARDPLVLVIEDLHWADPAVLELVESLVEHTAAVPLLVVCTTRLELFESRPGWSGGKRDATTVTLPPLAAGDTRALAREIMGADPPAELVRRAGGNPLFALELARAAVRGAVSSPPSLGAVIAARLDTLAPPARQVAFDAAVLGETFWPGAVAAVAGIDERDVETQLQRLTAADVVRRQPASSVAGQVEYAFLHVLVRDAAYERIPKTQRGHKHEAAAAWIERLAGGRVADHAELIAYHYEQALGFARALGDTVTALAEKTLRFLLVAGDHAMRVDVATAERFYRRALTLLGDGPQRGAILTQLAWAAQESGQLADAEALCRQAVEVLRQHDDACALGAALDTLYMALARRGRTAEAGTALAEALAVLQREPPGPELAAATVHAARERMLAGEQHDALEWAERARGLAEQLGLEHHVVRSLQFRGDARCMLNDLDGISDLRESLRRGLAAVEGIETAIAYGNLATWTNAVEGPRAALHLYDEGIQFSERRGFGHNAHYLSVAKLQLLFQLGRWDELLAIADEIVAWEQRRDESWISTAARTQAGNVLVRRGALAEGKPMLDLALAAAREVRDPQVLTRTLAYAAVAELAGGDGSAACERLEELESLTRDRAPFHRALYLGDATRVCAALGAMPLARRLVTDVDVTAELHVCSVVSGRAVVAETAGSLEEALDGYTEVAERWQTYGHALEHAHALIGRGRCLLALGRANDAAGPLAAARRTFQKLGAGPAVHEADALLVRA